MCILLDEIFKHKSEINISTECNFEFVYLKHLKTCIYRAILNYKSCTFCKVMYIFLYLNIWAFINFRKQNLFANICFNIKRFIEQ